jgi:hypothetical protein
VNSIVCAVRKQWVYWRCSELSVRLGVVGFKCSSCVEGIGRRRNDERDGGGTLKGKVAMHPWPPDAASRLRPPHAATDATSRGGESASRRRASRYSAQQSGLRGCGDVSSHGKVYFSAWREGIEVEFLSSTAQPVQMTK